MFLQELYDYIDSADDELSALAKQQWQKVAEIQAILTPSEIDKLIIYGRETILDTHDIETYFAKAIAQLFLSQIALQTIRRVLRERERN